MIYGYPRAVIDPEHGLQEMREVALQFEADDLRRIARFLQNAADRIDGGDWRSSHLHIDSVDKNWKRDFPACDLIVLHPSPVPPRRVGIE
jgi:hypothetical protein